MDLPSQLVTVTMSETAKYCLRQADLGCLYGLSPKPRPLQLKQKVKSSETPWALKGGSVAEALRKWLLLPHLGSRVFENAHEVMGKSEREKDYLTSPIVAEL